eukprot:UN01250
MSVDQMKQRPRYECCLDKFSLQRRTHWCSYNYTRSIF